MARGRVNSLTEGKTVRGVCNGLEGGSPHLPKNWDCDGKVILPHDVSSLAAKGMGGLGFDKGNFGDLECGMHQHHPSWMQIRGYQNALVNHVSHLYSNTVTGLVSG